jgi:hypothetical protein
VDIPSFTSKNSHLHAGVQEILTSAPGAGGRLPQTG